jgi:ABC-type sugar transport system ATPase subunit
VAFVKVRNIFQSYGNRPILERVNLTVAEGEFISIVGASGCGKSTFLRLLLAEEQPTRGTIRIEGRDPATEPGRERGVVFQRYSVFPHMTVRENIVAAEAFPTRFGRLSRPALREARDHLGVASREEHVDTVLVRGLVEVQKREVVGVGRVLVFDLHRVSKFCHSGLILNDPFH